MNNPPPSRYDYNYAACIPAKYTATVSKVDNVGQLLQGMIAEEPSDRNLTLTPEDESSEPEGSTLTKVPLSVDGWTMKQFTVVYRFFD